MKPITSFFVRPHFYLAIVCIAFVFGSRAFGQTTTLSYRPIAFEYSGPLNRLVLISSNPNRLHIHDPSTSESVSVPLAQPPLSVAVSPDGKFAAVGHDALISYVDLAKGAVARQFNVPTVTSSIILGSAWIYTYGDYSTSAYSVNIQTGQAVPNSGGSRMTGAKINTVTNAIYGTRDGTSPNDIEKWNIPTGPVTGGGDSPYHGDFCIYGPVWISPDGSRIYTGCGTVFRASTDPKLDMYYLSSIPGVNQIAGFTESVSLRRIALLRRRVSFSSGNQPDEAVVQVFDSAYLQPAGQFTLEGFEVGNRTYAPVGRAVYFTADSTELIVVKQADSSSGLLNDFAIQRIALGGGQECGATFETGSVEVPAEGIVATTTIKAATSCVYQATSLDSWITIVSGSSGSGNGTLQWSVSQNPDSVARSGTIVLPGQTLRITQGAALPNASALQVLAYRAISAAYAKSINKMILISANPNQLHIVDPTTRRNIAVRLDSPPLSLSVRADGTQAAVGHDGWITLVDLATASIVKVISVPTDVYSLILGVNGYAYLFPKAEWGDLFSVSLSSNQISRTSAIYNGREPRSHGKGKTIYVGGQSQSKWDISGGVAKLATGWPSSGGCGKLWLTEDGRRLFGECGRAFTTSDVPAQDYQYNGSLSNTGGIVWLEQSANAAMTAVIPSAGPVSNTASKQIGDTQVQLYGDAFLEYRGAIPLPSFTLGGKAFRSRGRYVFWNQAGNGLIALVQADDTALLTGGTAIVQLDLAGIKEVTVKTLVSAASQREGRIAPGQIVSIYGSGMGPKSGASFTLDPLTRKVSTNLAGTEVFINGVAAPILYASDSQVNAVVPFELSLTGEVVVQVGSESILTPPIRATMATAVPAIFTMNGSGSGQAVAVNLDGTVCDAANPAAAGSTIIVYFTGGGATSPAGSTGSVTSTLKRLAQTASATVADVPAAVSFAGAAPSFVEGVYQLNLKIDERTPAGTAQPLILTVGNNSSVATATIAVR